MSFLKFLGRLFCCLLMAGVVWGGVEIKGQVFERGTRVPLANAAVYLLPHKLKAITDESGGFVFIEVPEGEIQFVLNLSGYEKLEKTDSVEAETSKFHILYVEKISYSAFETTVVGQKSKKDISQKSLRQAQFLTLPGSGGDPVKAVQNLPGVNRVGGFSSQVVIQGAAPQDTKYDIDGHEIPIVFHFGGLTSVVMPEAVEQVDYLSAGYGPEYSRAMGGIISLKTRNPEVKDRPRKGLFFIDTLKSGALIEGRINEHSSYLISGRYSYIGLFLRQATKDNEAFNLTVAPEFSDLTVIYQNQLSERDQFKIDFLASRDTLSFLFKEPVKNDPKVRGNFSNETNFTRFIPQWTRKWDGERTSHLSAAMGRDYISVDVGEIYFRISSLVVTAKGDWEQQVSPDWKSSIGFDNQYSQFKVNLKVPSSSSSGGVANPVSTSELVEATIVGKSSNLGLYTKQELIGFDSTLIATPSLRLDKFGYTKEYLWSPRFSLRWNQNTSLLWKVAGGLYFQPPQAQEVDGIYGNPQVKSPSAIHSTFGFEKDFREGSNQGFQFSSALFRRDFSKLVVSSSALIEVDGYLVTEKYNNSGGGRSQGLESQLKFDFLPWSGWLSYTYSQARRWDPANPEYDFQYDQTHNFNLVAAYEAKKNWKYSGRLRYVTGNPTTPVVGAAFDADNDTYVPSRGPIYSERQQAFFQIDARVDKKWILDTEIWAIYLDIQNVLNTKNPEQLRYSYDYSQKEAVTGLPILPALGIKGEF